jgi:phage-related protein
LLTIPLIPAWGTQIAFIPRNRKTTFGKGGVIGRAFDGINTVAASWSVSVSLTDRNTVEKFLQDRQEVEPFLVDGRTEAYTCADWSWDWVGEGVWKFSGKFEQSFRLKV